MGVYIRVPYFKKLHVYPIMGNQIKFLNSNPVHVALEQNCVRGHGVQLVRHGAADRVLLNLRSLLDRTLTEGVGFRVRIL